MTVTRVTAPTAADLWRDVAAARLPAAHLAVLAPVRDRAAVRVVEADGAVWVRWPAGLVDVVRCLLPVPGVEFFVPRGGRWYRFGSRLPTADGPPSDEGSPVAILLAPARFEPALPAGRSGSPVVLRVVRGGEPRVATALACGIADLAKWTGTATTMELSAVTAARSGERVVLRGRPAPSIPSATRFWGDDLLVPLGFRPDPDLPAAALRAAVGAAADELVVLDGDGAEIIARSAFEPLTRAGVRLALSEAESGGFPT